MKLSPTSRTKAKSSSNAELPASPALLRWSKKMPPIPRGSLRCFRKKYSSHHALNRSASATFAWRSQASRIAAWNSKASGRSGTRRASSIGVRSAPPPNQVLVVRTSRTFMWAVGTCGLHGWAMTETPAAQKRGSSAAPGNLRRRIRPGRPRTPSSNARPSSRTAGRAASPCDRRRRAPPLASVAAPRLDREAAGLPRGVGAGKLVLEPLHRRDDPLLQSAKPRRRGGEAGVGMRARDRAYSTHRPAHPRHHALDMGDRRLGQDAVAEVEDMRPGPEAREHAIDPFVERRAAATRASGSRLPCSATLAGKRGDRGGRLDRGVEADRRDAVHAGELSELRRRAARERR